jgi:hypothetical protein
MSSLLLLVALAELKDAHWPARSAALEAIAAFHFRGGELHGRAAYRGTLQG